MKTWKHAIIGIIALTALAFTACKDVNDNGKETPKPVEVTFNVPDECTNLNKTKPITILFPATFTVARMDNIKGKFVDSMKGLNTSAGNNPEFQAKINAILDRGLKITVEETNIIDFGMKVVDNQLMAETAYLEHGNVDGGQIAAIIIWAINNNHLVKAPQPNAIKLCNAVCQTLNIGKFA
jgi:hypothetical protein